MSNQFQSKPVPLTIIAGFLGAGKTTLLNHILHAEHGMRVAVLVNDFGAINIDSKLVVGVEGETVSLANGCICCTIRDDLISAILNLLRRDDPPEYLIIETSGVADPIEVANSFRIAAVAPLVQIDAILTVIDAEQIRTIDRQYEMLAFNQISIADIVIVNKVDLVDGTAVDALRRWIREITPDARLIETTQAIVPLELIIGTGRYDPARLISQRGQDVHIHEAGEQYDHKHRHDHSTVFSTWHWSTDEPLALNATRRAINNLPTSIYRAKGVLYMADDPDRRVILQVVGRRARLLLGDAWGDTTPHSEIVVIGAHDSLDTTALAVQFEGCLASKQSRSGLGRLTGGMLDWLRGS